MINFKNITICTTCMNRNQFLNRSLLTWIRGDFHEIIITDWSSSIPVSQSLNEIRSELMEYRGGVRIVEVQGQELFNCTRSRNMAARYCQTPFIWFVDSDVMVDLDKMHYFEPMQDTFYHGTLLLTGAPTTGTCLVHRVSFQKVGGYSERISTLPGEDLDLYKRLRSCGVKRKFFPFRSLKHIPHPYELRTKHRPWFGMNRAQGTRVAHRTETWTSSDRQTVEAHEVKQYKNPDVMIS